MAIVGEIHTANLGIERIVTNVTAHASIRFLLLCG
ncbi:MAG: tetrahydromethanopterin S-methyltransferase subunit A, partial [Thermomicrobia bacterium]|nr:tetrahydromethanopterin S-methyltransferase subunit A [Thermomicrobia bacterium]